MGVFKTIKKFFNIHFDLPAIIIVLLIISLFYRRIVYIIFSFIEFLETNLPLPAWGQNIWKDVSVEIFSAVLIAFFIFVIFKIKTKSSLVGDFEAYVISDGGERLWGDVKTTYNPFSNRIKGMLYEKNGDAVIAIDGIFDKGQYLRGYYTEKKKTVRRRMGAFLFTLSGEGDTYRGPYVYVDPETDKPQVCEAKWVRKV